ncbi:hypothetical protein F511_30899 [Dorcoceras hygrometricum]|uniref:Uncharacterized protein n=1 Tax=Dorcoceras hygrometricum TaxID=472368 RepID=A0A2Z7B9G5_9LAMI|nr:hypothetical protein F511_30899 [Dorcoceras hygrometricum]
MGEFIHVEEEEAARLSFSNLPLGENNSGSLHQSPRNSSPRGADHLFEFFKSQNLPIYSNQGIVFCGKIIHGEEEEVEELNEFQKRDYFANWRSRSFRGSAIPTDRKENGDISFRRHWGLTRFSTAPSYRVQSVNISALTSMSSKSRRRMFMFGPVKFKPEMELSQIKKRLRREPAAAQGKEVVSRGGSGRRLWGVVRSNLRLRWRLTSVLTKSFGCLSVGGTGGERLNVGVGCN